MFSLPDEERNWGESGIAALEAIILLIAFVIAAVSIFIIVSAGEAEPLVLSEPECRVYYAAGWENPEVEAKKAVTLSARLDAAGVCQILSWESPWWETWAVCFQDQEKVELCEGPPPTPIPTPLP